MANPQRSPSRPIATCSLVARDPETNDLGVVVASKFLAVGAVVPTAVAGVGAVATQSYANVSYGPRALAILERGGSPDDCLQEFEASDDNFQERRSEEHTSELQSRGHLVCRLLLEKKKEE